jgi:hypothetical protein
VFLEEEYMRYEVNRKSIINSMSLSFEIVKLSAKPYQQWCRHVVTTPSFPGATQIINMHAPAKERLHLQKQTHESGLTKLK